MTRDQILKSLLSIGYPVYTRGASTKVKDFDWDSFNHHLTPIYSKAVVLKDGKAIGENIFLTVPGVKAEELNLNIEDNKLSVTIEQKAISIMDENGEEHSFPGINEKFAFTLNENTDFSKIEAEITNGVLVIKTRFLAEKMPQSIKIKCK